MKVVLVLNGFYGEPIQALSFMTKEMDFITLELTYLESIRSSKDKVILTYDKVTVNKKNASGFGMTLSKMKLHAIYAKKAVPMWADYEGAKKMDCYDVNVTDIHIYDRTKKAEIYIIPKKDILSAVIDYTEEALS